MNNLGTRQTCKWCNNTVTERAELSPLSLSFFFSNHIVDIVQTLFNAKNDISRQQVIELRVQAAGWLPKEISMINQSGFVMKIFSFRQGVSRKVIVEEAFQSSSNKMFLDVTLYISLSMFWWYSSAMNKRAKQALRIHSFSLQLRKKLLVLMQSIAIPSPKPLLPKKYGKLRTCRRGLSRSPWRRWRRWTALRTQCSPSCPFWHSRRRVEWSEACWAVGLRCLTSPAGRLRAAKRDEWTKNVSTTSMTASDTYIKITLASSVLFDLPARVSLSITLDHA